MVGGQREAMNIRSLALTVVAFSTPPLDCVVGSTFAADFCVELTAAEFNHSAERRGDDNACAGRHPSKIGAIARDRARDNANNALASQCLDNVTLNIAQSACTRLNFVTNTSPNNSRVDSPPVSLPGADKVRYIGHGTGSAAGVNLCVVAHDIRVRTRNVVDGQCPRDIGLLPHRIFATARASARCAVICGPP
jgi:hypothetical protein